MSVLLPPKRDTPGRQLARVRAVVYEAFGRLPTIESVPDPVTGPHGAVLRVEATGLCRSDWHAWMGHDPDVRRFPHVPGHELAGVVEAVGERVTRWAPGDRVTRRCSDSSKRVAYDPATSSRRGSRSSRLLGRSSR